LPGDAAAAEDLTQDVFVRALGAAYGCEHRRGITLEGWTRDRRWRRGGQDWLWQA
jgi:DNA-directed RNA polymerase specialized sigma24 family protein